MKKIAAILLFLSIGAVISKSMRDITLRLFGDLEGERYDSLSVEFSKFVIHISEIFPVVRYDKLVNDLPNVAIVQNVTLSFLFKTILQVKGFKKDYNITDQHFSFEVIFDEITLRRHDDGTLSMIQTGKKYRLPILKNYAKLEVFAELTKEEGKLIDKVFLDYQIHMEKILHKIESDDVEKDLDKIILALNKLGERKPTQKFYWGTIHSYNYTLQSFESKHKISDKIVEMKNIVTKFNFKVSLGEDISIIKDATGTLHADSLDFCKDTQKFVSTTMESTVPEATDYLIGRFFVDFNEVKEKFYEDKERQMQMQMITFR